MKKIYLLFILFSTLLMSCNSTGSLNTDQNDQVYDAPNASDTVNTQKPSIELTASEASNLIDEWNLAINKKNYSDLPQFYGTDINYNSKIIGNEAIINLKKKDLEKNSVSKQEINALKVDAPVANVRKIQFKKTYITKDTKKDFQTTLMLENQNGKWKIVAENDKPLDVTLKSESPRFLSEKDINTCERAATAIFLSSQEIKDLLSNPQVEYKIEYRPGDVSNPNNKYWFWVFLPHDRNVETYGRYQVDPNNGLLYQYDAVADDVKIIPADNTLQKNVKKYCNNKP